MAKRFKVIKGGAAKRGVTSPSSTRKKVVKEGSPKFVGPRTKASEKAEERDSLDFLDRAEMRGAEASSLMRLDGVDDRRDDPEATGRYIRSGRKHMRGLNRELKRLNRGRSSGPQSGTSDRVKALMARLKRRDSED